MNGFLYNSTSIQRAGETLKSTLTKKNLLFFVRRANGSKHEEHEAAAEPQAERDGNDGSAAADNGIPGVRGLPPQVC